MSSTFPTSSANAPRLGLFGCNSETKESNSSSVSPACNQNPIDEDRTQTQRQISHLAPNESVECQLKLDKRNAKKLDTVRNEEPKELRTAAVAQQPIPLSERTGSPRIFHRIATVRKNQGLTERTVAKRLGVDVRTYRTMECPTTDLTLSELASVQKALDVPLIDLIEDRQSLSRPVEERAKLVKTMKTAVAIRESAPNQRAERLAQMLFEQLVDVMPELRDVSGWPQFGARRGQSAIGKALAQPIDMSELRIE